ncbi:MAG TPA: RidA family protein [Rhizobiales bacterium]|nr:RidA family protein [Hyphomicrobiales bacterium]
MSHDIEKRLLDLGIELPEAAAPAANYVPWTLHGNQLFVSGQLPIGPNGIEVLGHLGDDVSLEMGQIAAQRCAVNLLAQAKAALNGDFSRLKGCIRIGVFVSSTAGFHDHHLVANGASDLIAAALGSIASHTRAAVGVASLPLNAAVEADAIFAVD